MAAFFFGIHKTGEGYSEIPVPVIHRIHSPDHQCFFPFLRKQGKLGTLIAQVGQSYTQKPYRLLNTDGCLINVTTQADGMRHCLLFAETGIEIRIPDLQVDGFFRNPVTSCLSANHF